MIIIDDSTLTLTTELTWTDFDDKDHLGVGHEILPEEQRVAKLIFYQQVGDNIQYYMKLQYITRLFSFIQNCN